MKIIYTILFFLDTLILTMLISRFFKLLDQGIGNFTFSLMLLAILFCVALLAFLLVNYFKLPPSEKFK